jgi:hypothetical protein
MSVTATETNTGQDVLDRADPNELADILRKIKLGQMLNPVKVSFTGLSATAAKIIAQLKAGSTGVTVNQGLQIGAADPLPSILSVVAVRVAGGSAAAGVRMIGDAGATASSTVARLSDDGTTLTFEDTVTAMVLEYIPRPATDLNAKFERT